MPSSKKNRRRKDFVNTNKKREWRKLKRKQNLRIPCDQIRQSWDSEKTVKQNLAEMGLTVDPNQSMKKPSKPFMPKVIEEEKVEAPFKPEVIKGMEIEVQMGEKEKRFQLPSEDVLFCTHMLEKHNDDYKAMARDKRNMYQLTPKQIRNKIREFKRSKQQYEKYLNDKRHLSKEDVMDTGDAIVNS